MTNFIFVSANTFLTLPPVKQLYEFLKDEYRTSIIHSTISGYEDFFTQEENYHLVNHYDSYSVFRQQNAIEKLAKIIKLIYLYFVVVKLKASRKEKTIVYTSELFSLFVSMLLKGKNERIVYHQFEILEKKKNLLDKLSYWYVRHYFQKIDLAIFPEINRSKLFVKEVKRYSDDQLLILPNTNNNECESLEVKNEDKTIITYIGSIEWNYHVDNFMQSVSQFDQSKIEIRFIGRLTPDVARIIDKYQLDSVKLIGQIQHWELEKYYKETDIGILLYKDTALSYRYCAPNKLYEYWSYGVPVIGDKLPGLLSVFTNNKLGVLVDMNDPKEIGRAIESIRNSLNKEEVLDYFVKNYKLSNYLPKLNEKLKQVI